MTLCRTAPSRKANQISRRRLKEERLAYLSALIEVPKSTWAPITMRSCYGGAQRTAQTVYEGALWYSTRVCLVRVRVKPYWRSGVRGEPISIALFGRKPRGRYLRSSRRPTFTASLPVRWMSW